MHIGYMWVVRLGLTSVRLMDKGEHGDKEQLSGVIMKASYGEMREGRERREGETRASTGGFPFDGWAVIDANLGSPDTREEIQEPGVTYEPKRQPWHLREIGI